MAQQSAIYVQLHSPTGITHCASAFLTHAEGQDTRRAEEESAMPNLVVARSTAVDVYSIRLVGRDWRLALRGRFPLFGVVESLAVLKGAPGQRDALMLTFREAKLSVLCWDTELSELAPTGLHYFEGDPALKAGRTLFPTPPIVVADPQGRCAAVVMFRHQLAVLPAMRGDSEALPFLGLTEAEAEAGAGAGAGAGGQGSQAASPAATLGNSYVDNLAKAGIKEVRDAAFLHGYNEPVLLLLHEDDPTWAGSLRTKKDTCCLTALSLNLSTKRHPRIWAAQNLPWDAQRLIPVPTGGALVLCTHMVLFFAQGHQTGVVVNSAALALPPAPAPLTFEGREPPAVTAANHAKQYALSIRPDTVPSTLQFCDTESAVGLGLELDGARGTWLAERAGSAPDGKAPVLLLALRGGQLVLVRPLGEGGSPRRLEVTRASAVAAPPCSCITALGRQGQLFFLGSHQGDSLLLRAVPALLQPAAPAAGAAAAAEGAAAGSVAAAKDAGGDAAGPDVAPAAAAAAAEPAAVPATAPESDVKPGGPSPDTAAAGGGGTAAAEGDGAAEEPSPKRQRLEQEPAEGGGEAAPEQPAAAEAAEASVEAQDAAAVAEPSGMEGVEGSGDGAEQAAAAAPGDDSKVEEQQQDGMVEEYAEDEEVVDEEGEGAGEEMVEYSESVLPGELSDSDEEALIYGEAVESHAEGGEGGAAAAAGLRYNLKIVDSLINIGPIRDAAVGGVGSDVYPPYLVTCGGRERGGALCMLRQHVVPEITIEVPLPGVVGVWSVHHRAEGAAQVPEGQPPYHSYLLISFPGSTKVLTTGEELEEVTVSAEFATDTTTLAAGSMRGDRRIVQVFPEGVRVLDGCETSQELWAADLAGQSQSGSGATTITAASILDPLILVSLSNGSAVLLEADAATGRLAVAEHGRHVLAGSGSAGAQITAACLYRDTHGMLASQQPASRSEAAAATPPQEDSSACGLSCGLCYADGRLEVYQLPGWQCVFQYRNLGEGPKVLDSGGAAATDSPDGVSPAQIVELRLESFGDAAATAPGSQGAPAAPGASRGPGPLQLALVALTSEHTLLVYHAFRTPQGALKFRRQPLSALPPVLPPVATTSSSGVRVPRISRFDSLGEDPPCWGLFVAGQCPAMLVAARGALLPHPFYLPAGLGVSAFTPFHNINCPFGFIMACVGEGQGSLRICQPPPRTRLDCPWPRTKIHLRATPLRIAHYPEADLFAVLTARQVPYRPFLPEDQDPNADPHASYAYALAEAAAKMRGTMDGHEVRLVDPESWTSVWRYSLLPGEKALTVKAVHLRDGTTGATVPLLAVGAGLVAGEDYPCLGRVLLFRVHRADSGKSGSAGEWTASLVYSRDFRGPVSAVSGLEGYLLLSAGNRIETLALTTVEQQQPQAAVDGDAELATPLQAYKFNRTSFYDGPMLVTSLNVVKNFVLLGDAQHSVQFVRYKDEGRQLALLSKDFSCADVTTTEFLINGSSLHMACADGGGVLRLLSYSPNHPSSWRGQKLVPWGVFQLGDAPMCMLRMKLHQAGDTTVRQAVLFGDGAGSIGAVAPLLHAETMAVLNAVQHELVMSLQHTAGLNPASFRMMHTNLSQSLHGARWFGQQLPGPGVLDGDVLLQYCHLSRRVQEQIARAAGTTKDAIITLLTHTVSTLSVF